MTTRITEASLARTMLHDLGRVDARLVFTQRQLSSGKRITRPSDDPFGTGRAIGLRGELEGIRQFRRNVDEANGWTTATESALSRMATILQRARELMIQGGSDSNDVVAREAIASEIDALTEALKQEANTTYGGRYVFAGTKTETPPYAVGGGDEFAGDEEAIARSIGAGVSVTINVIGRELLGDGQAAADNRLLHVLRDVAEHLRGGTPADAEALRGVDLERLDVNFEQLSRIRAVVGANANRLEIAASRLEELEESSLNLLSRVEDADMAETIVKFSTQQAAYQSALHAAANIVQTSLLDFLR